MENLSKRKAIIHKLISKKAYSQGELPYLEKLLDKEFSRIKKKQYQGYDVFPENYLLTYFPERTKKSCFRCGYTGPVGVIKKIDNLFVFYLTKAMLIIGVPILLIIFFVFPNLLIILILLFLLFNLDDRKFNSSKRGPYSFWFYCPDCRNIFIDF